MLGDKIHKALRQAAKTHNFPMVNYPGNARTTTATVVPAKTILSNELTASFITPRRNRLTYRREKSAWTWELLVAFDRAVSLESFEDSLVESPPTIPRDEDEGTPQVVMLLEDAEYRHPPTTSPSSGTRVRYRFTADLSPV